MSKYITPNMSMHDSFKDVLEFKSETEYYYFLLSDRNQVKFNDLYANDITFVIAEPGYGKTRLLKEIVIKAKMNHKEAIFMDLKKVQFSLSQFIKDHVSKAVVVSLKKTEIDLDKTDLIKTPDFELIDNTSTIVCLDALDEVKKERFSDIVDSIKEFIKEYPQISIFISCRRHHFIKYQNLFLEIEAKFIRIGPFSRNQTTEYLKTSSLSETDIEKVIETLEVKGRQLIIQVPRYLGMLTSILQPGTEHGLNLKKADLFEYFIYKKLEIEEDGAGSKTKEIAKRVLEKLALLMEMYQTNTLTKEELITFFDDVDSNICVSFLHQVPIQNFYDRSLLKDNIETIEFENTEFQEYLAAKEIARMGQASQTFFELAVDKELREIYPSWFNTISFLLDFLPSLLKPILDFSVSKPDVVQDEEFHRLIIKFDANKLNPDERRHIFNTIFLYYQDVLHWIEHDIAENLVDFFDSSLTKTLKDSTDGKKYKGKEANIRRGNVAYLLAFLLRKNKLDYSEQKYWKQRLLKFAETKDDNGVLQRHILLALRQFKDILLIKQIQPLLIDDELVQQEFLKACIETDPNDEFSINSFVQGTKMKNIYARYGLYEVKELKSIKLLLNSMIKDSEFLNNLIDRERVFHDGDHVLIDNLKTVWDIDLYKKLKQLLSSAFTEMITYKAESSKLIREIALLLKDKQPQFIFELISDIKKSEQLKKNIFGFTEIFSNLLETTQVEKFVNEMKTLDHGDRVVLWTMQRLYFSDRDMAKEIYEEGRKYLPKEYEDYEEHRKQESQKRSQAEEIYEKFKFKLEPEPGKYDPGVFDFYLNNKEKIAAFITGEDRQRLQKLITGSVFDVYDPGEQKLRINKRENGSTSYTTDTFISVFGDCIQIANEMGIDISKYRSKIIHYIPFAYHEHLKAIFSLINNPSESEINGLLTVYTRKRKDDLAIFMPDSFIEACVKYNISNAVPLLKNYVGQKDFPDRDRVKALAAIVKLESDKHYLNEIFKRYCDDPKNEEYELREKANKYLIELFEDADAIDWRFEQLKDRAFPYTAPKGAHWVGPGENELREKYFASPLMKIKSPSYLTKYLDLLKESFAILLKGEDYWSYSRYLWDVVKQYFDNLKELRSYAYLKLLESEIQTKYSNVPGVNWFKYLVKDLKRNYINYISKPGNFTDCIKQYNAIKRIQYSEVVSPRDLVEIVKKVVQEDIRLWVESEGAYSFIQEATRHQEDLIQKTIKTQLEIGLIKSGLRGTDIRREEQLLDGKRIDFLISYGFIGPVMIEVKRVDNDEVVYDAQRDAYRTKFLQYIKGTRALYGLFLIFQINNNKSLEDYLPKLIDVYKDCDNVEVLGYNCLLTTNNE